MENKPMTIAEQMYHWRGGRPDSLYCFLLAVVAFSADYHGGQFTDIYRYGCLASKYLDRWYNGKPQSVNYNTMRLRDIIYKKLVRKYTITL
jgi:hypothetical protein